MAYYIYNKGLHALISHEKQASLKEATHPDRVRRLNEEARKARDKQQLELQKSAQEYTKKQAQKQLEQKTQNLAKLSQDGGRTLKHKNGT